LRNIFLILLIGLTVFLAACSGKGTGVRKEQKKTVIRYVNLNSLYTALSKMEPGYESIAQKRRQILDEIENLQEKILSEKSSSKTDLDQLKQKRKDLERLDSSIRSMKSRIYSRVNSALKQISRNGNIDFILNLGDGLVYAGKKYDITEDVMREIIRQKKRSAPVSR
jgi:Skp family chaperone for outer membrane proteins